MNTYRNEEAADETPSLSSKTRAIFDKASAMLVGGQPVERWVTELVKVSGAAHALVVFGRTPEAWQRLEPRDTDGRLLPQECVAIVEALIRQAFEGSRCVVRELLVSDADAGWALATPVFVGADRLQPRAALYMSFPRNVVGNWRDEQRLACVAANVLGALLEHEEREPESCPPSAPPPSSRHKPLPLSEILASASMRSVREELHSALGGTSTILLVGESGTGKTLLAQAIAEASGRRPIVRAMLGSSDDLNTITSELFGHEKGAFSGATSKRVGLVERADRGTLILDEILNLPPHAQQLLLDFTQFGLYRPLGHTSANPKHADVRLIAATNGDLDAAVRERRFREDLYFRLASVKIELPPLRSRRMDIPQLALAALARSDPNRTWTLSPALQAQLTRVDLHWPGNVRQLEQVIQRARERALDFDPNATELATVHVDSPSSSGVRPATQPPPPSGSVTTAWDALQAERAALEERERQVIERALENSGGVVARAARELGVARTTLASRIEATRSDRRLARRSEFPSGNVA